MEKIIEEKKYFNSGLFGRPKCNIRYQALDAKRCRPNIPVY